MRSNSQRARLATVFLYVVAGSSFIFSLHYLVNVYQIIDLKKGGGLPIDQLRSLATVFSIATLLYALSYLLCGIYFILWFTRAYRNLQIALPKSKFAYPSWAAAVTWFVPVWNIFGPYKIATNLFDKTEDFLMSEDKMSRNRNYDIVKGSWWALWIVSAVLIRISAYYATKNIFSISANIGAFIGFLLSITCAFMAIQMIKNYSKMDQLLMQAKSNGISDHKPMANDDLLDTGI